MKKKRNPGRVIALGSMKGGCGKSTIARTLAVELKAMGFSVLLADLDTEQDTIIHWSNRRVEKGLPEIVVRSFASVAKAREQRAFFDYVVIDLKPRAKSMFGDLANIAEIMLIPARPCLDDCQPAAMVWGKLQTAKTTAKVACILNSCTTDYETHRARRYLEAFGVRVLDHVVPEKPGYRMAQDGGYALSECMRGKLSDRAKHVLSDIFALIEDVVLKKRTSNDAVSQTKAGRGRSNVTDKQADIKLVTDAA